MVRLGITVFGHAGGKGRWGAWGLVHTSCPLGWPRCPWLGDSCAHATYSHSVWQGQTHGGKQDTMTPRVRPTGVPRGPFPVGFVQSMTWITCTVPHISTHIIAQPCTLSGDVPELLQGHLHGGLHLPASALRGCSVWARTMVIMEQQCQGCEDGDTAVPGDTTVLGDKAVPGPRWQHSAPPRPFATQTPTQPPCVSPAAMGHQPGAAAPLGPGEFGPQGWR